MLEKASRMQQIVANVDIVVPLSPYTTFLKSDRYLIEICGREN